MNQQLNRLMGAVGVAGGVFVIANQLLRASRWFDFRNKSVVVTGGVRGLGLCLARQLLSAGARVTICSRSPHEISSGLDQLADELSGRVDQVLGIPCDVSDRNQTDHLIKTAVDRFGTVDVLINNAGIIEVGPLDSMTTDDFHRAMDVHCWGPLNTVSSVLPIMRSAGWGRIVNVASVGGEIPTPHLLPYVASKFALVGLSGGLRAELAKENILVTTICPGLMRTGSPRNASFKGQHRKEYAWFSIGDSLPIISIDAMSAAGQILRACQYGDAKVTLGSVTKLASLLAALAPNATAEVLALVDRWLPTMGGIGQQAARGYESQSQWLPSTLTRQSEMAALRNNEFSNNEFSRDQRGSDQRTV